MAAANRHTAIAGYMNRAMLSIRLPFGTDQECGVLIRSVRSSLAPLEPLARHEETQEIDSLAFQHNLARGYLGLH